MKLLSEVIQLHDVYVSTLYHNNSNSNELMIRQMKSNIYEAQTRHWYTNNNNYFWKESDQI